MADRDGAIITARGKERVAMVVAHDPYSLPGLAETEVHKTQHDTENVSQLKKM